MAFSGKLRTWNDDRGFGFLAPRDGGRELFVHISSFPRDGSRPTVGETLLYELGQGKDGKPQAVKVCRQALGHPSTYPREPSQSRRTTRSTASVLVGLALLVAVGAFGYGRYNQYVAPSRPNAPVPSRAASSLDGLPGSHRCDGRKYCSQMTSCTEAKFFLENCPGTQMDGNHDGVPCEQQWCTRPFSD
jgi:cold shock CspA family protein